MHIYTPPDLDMDSELKKIWIFNCSWTQDQIVEAFTALPQDKDFDVYIYDESMKDAVWEEGIKHKCVKRYNCKDFANLDHVQIAKRIYDEFR